MLLEAAAVVLLWVLRARFTEHIVCSRSGLGSVFDGGLVEMRCCMRLKYP